MAILVLQLARFGDIFQTWPTLKALRRTHPQADLHLLVRERFVEATGGLEALGIQVHVLPTAKILEPFFNGTGDDLRCEAEAMNELENFVRPLKDLAFSSIINLSFSPFSSYLTDELAHEGTNIHGYTRHRDGFLCIPDDSSAYFYAQVGVGKSNRYHLCDVFAAVAGVELTADDFNHVSRVGQKGNSVLVHLGASQAEKTYPAEMWIEVLQKLVDQIEGSVVLVGSANERKLSDAIAVRVKSGRLLNRVGQSSLSDLCRWVNEAALVVGADSAPIQIASLTGTRVLNLSCAAVNFWETGPLTDGSRILYASEMHEIPVEQVVTEALELLVQTPPRTRSAFAVREKSETRPLVIDVTSEFRWRLLQALYTAGDYPELPESASPLAFHRLFDVAELAVQQMDLWLQKGPSTAIQQILESVDHLLVQLPQMDANVGPIVDWFQTERLRLPPASPDETLHSTRALFEQLLWVAAVYHRRSEGNRMLERAGDLIRLCATPLREYDLNSVQDAFQELMSIAQAAAASPTKVGENPWPEVLNRLENALTRRDLIEVADILESDWTEVLQSASRQLSWESGSAGQVRRTTIDPN